MIFCFFLSYFVSFLFLFLFCLLEIFSVLSSSPSLKYFPLDTVFFISQSYSSFSEYSFYNLLFLFNGYNTYVSLRAFFILMIFEVLFCSLCYAHHSLWIGRLIIVFRGPVIKGAGDLIFQDVTLESISLFNVVYRSIPSSAVPGVQSLFVLVLSEEATF